MKLQNVFITCMGDLWAVNYIYSDGHAGCTCSAGRFFSSYKEAVEYAANIKLISL
jgi:hypothetical protein